MPRHDLQRLFFGTVCTCFAAALSACSLHDARASSLRPVPERAQPARYEPATPADRYLSHIALLAHDELEGRGIGSDGIDLAAGYIAGQFAAAGLKPGGPDGTYFQEFIIERRPELGDDTILRAETDSGEIDAELQAEFVPFGFSAQGDFEGDLVFAGYGITNPDKSYDDYAGIDVKNRVVLMLRREPPDFDPSGYTRHARFDQKVTLAAEKGAVAVLIANQDPGEDGIDGLMRFGRRDDHGIPAIHVKRELADQLLKAGGLPSLMEMQRQLDETGTNASAPLTSVRVTGNVTFEAQETIARNVIGVLPGTGPGHDEHIVIGAHYDHVGIHRGLIHNGADDNASGTAGVIELAWSLTDVPNRDRSVIFMAFTGEETGLHGSRHFAEHPTVESDSIVAMINLDMIGRLDEEDEANMLAIQGLGTGESFKEIVNRRTQEAGMEYVPDDSANGPSDHASFYAVDIPSLFFFTGIHADLHQPTDDTEKINAEGAVKVVKLISNIALDLINAEAPPVFASVDERANVFRGASSMRPRVVMGVMPDMEDESDEPGWRIARVFPDTGAAKAGMKLGDRIIQIDGVTIEGLDDYRDVTGDKNPGDVLKVTVLREKQKLTLDVQLSSPGEVGP